MPANHESEMRLLPDSEPHQEFLELCARSSTGLLSRQELHELRCHLADCPPCRHAEAQYCTIVDRAIPRVSASRLPQNLDPGPGWFEARAEADLFKRIARADGQGRAWYRSRTASGNLRGIAGLAAFASPAMWQRVWITCGAVVVLFFVLGFCAYATV